MSFGILRTTWTPVGNTGHPSVIASYTAIILFLFFLLFVELFYCLCVGLKACQPLSSHCSVLAVVSTIKQSWFVQEAKHLVKLAIPIVSEQLITVLAISDLEWKVGTSVVECAWLPISLMQ